MDEGHDMGILKVVEWLDDSKNTIVYKVPLGDKNTINKGSMLVVRDGQVAVFADKGRMADVFFPGTYKLDTENIPIITKLLSWKYGFERPFKSDIYYVKTTQFVDQKWGTTSPIIIRDKDYGAVRVRGYGSYSFRVKDAYEFMKELSGTGSTYETKDIIGYLRSLLITDMTTALGKSKLSILDMAANLGELASSVKVSIQDDIDRIGIILVNFNIENFSLPEELEKMLDKSTSLNMMRGNMDVYTQMAAADALKEAAKNPGMAGTTIGAGMGIGMGVGLGNMFGNAFSGINQNINQSNQQNNQPTTSQNATKCVACGADMNSTAKFCPECGQKTKLECPKCSHLVSVGVKFCPECGENLASSTTIAQPMSLPTNCSQCGATLLPNAKFCPDCGEKV